MPKKSDSSHVTICWSCHVDLRFANIKYHKDLGHKVEAYDHDPRIRKPKEKKS